MCCSGDEKDRPRVGLVDAKDRSCTDVLFLLLFVGSFLGVVWVYADARSKGGDPRRLIKPQDFEGRICGTSSGNVSGKPLGAWPDPIGAPLFRVCVASCNETQDRTRFVYGVSSVDFFGFYCLPVPEQFELLNNATAVITVPGEVGERTEFVARAVGDVSAARYVILAAPAVALAASFIWCYFLRHFATAVVWSTLVLFIAGSAAIGFAFLDEAKERSMDEDVEDNRGKAAQITGIVFLSLAGVVLLVAIALRKRIAIAIEVIREGSKSLVTLPCLICVPVVPLALVLVYTVPMLYVTLYVFSIGDYREAEVPATITGTATGGSTVQSLINPDYEDDAWVSSSNSTYRIFVWDENERYSVLFLVFQYFYTTAFLIYVTYFVIAGAVAEWYYTPYVGGKKPRGSGKGELSNTAIVNSWGRTIRYHLGTVSVGALIIAVVRTLRAILVYIEEKAKPADGKPSRLQRCLFCACHCCLWCLECCLDKINKNAFIYSAVQGTNFATSVCSSFALVWRNLLRMAVLEVITVYITFLGKIMIAFMTAGGLSLYMQRTEALSTEISSPVVPAVICFVLGYSVASLFMSIFDVAVDTTFMCFLIDEENNGTNMFASKKLQEVVGRFEKESADVAAKRVTRRSANRWPEGQPPRGMENYKQTSSSTEMQGR